MDEVTARSLHFFVYLLVMTNKFGLAKNFFSKGIDRFVFL